MNRIPQYFVYLLVRFALSAMLCLPRRMALRIAVGIADFVYRIDRRHREIGLVNLSIAFPRLSQRKKELVLRGSYHNFGRLVVESARLSLLNRENVAGLVSYDTVNGLQNYLAAQKMSRGVIFMTLHYGAWELLPQAHALFGNPLSFVIRRLDNKYLDQFVRSTRQSCGNQVIDKQGAARRMLQELRHGRDVGILIDQSVAPEEGVFADFFGRPASSPSILAILALRTDAPVVPGAIRYDRRRDRHQMIFHPALDLIKTGDREQDIQLNTAQYNRRLERIIRQKPSQWLWMHRRWKAQPKGTPNPVSYASTVAPRLSS